MTKLAAAFKTAWNALKTGATKVEAFIVKAEPVVQEVVTEGSAITDMVAPALAPAVTAFDSAEEIIMGKVLALLQNAETAPTVSTLFADELPLLQSIKDVVVNHPAVAALTATPATTK